MPTQSQAGPGNSAKESVAVSRWVATLLVIAAIVYFIMPWDLDFVPVIGRLDDLFFLAFAGYYYWKRSKGLGDATRRGPTPRNAPAGAAPPADQSEEDLYRLFGVSRKDDAETIKRAYRDLVAKYHPDRVQHLGEEFKAMADSKTTAINSAYEKIKKARNFS
jgi:hypothetical protein